MLVNQNWVIGLVLRNDLISHPLDGSRLLCQPQTSRPLNTRVPTDSRCVSANLIPLIPNQEGGMYSSNRNGPDNRIAFTKLGQGKNLDCVFRGMSEVGNFNGS